MCVTSCSEKNVFEIHKTSDRKMMLENIICGDFRLVISKKFTYIESLYVHMYICS